MDALTSAVGTDLAPVLSFFSILLLGLGEGGHHCPKGQRHCHDYPGLGSKQTIEH